jgi:hypothetical protein
MHGCFGITSRTTNAMTPAGSGPRVIYGHQVSVPVTGGESAQGRQITITKASAQR